MRRLAQRPRGGSGNNPYLEPTRTAMEYTVVIQPQGIAKKIMQVCSFPTVKHTGDATYNIHGVLLSPSHFLV